MEWNTADKLNQKLREVLSSSHKDNWDVIVNQYKDENATEDENGNITAAPFNEEVFFTLLDTFIAEFFGENDYKNQVKFLRNVKKPPSMTPTRFKQLFDIHNGLLKYFAHAPIDAGFAEEEAKDICLNGMPEIFQEKFEDSNQTASGATRNNMRAHFEGLQQRHPYKKHDGNRSGQSNQRNPNNNSHNRCNRQNYNSNDNQGGVAGCCC